MAASGLVSNEKDISLCEALDRVLNKGVVVAGEVVISVAGIDLIYLNLQTVLTSVETLNQMRVAESLPKTEKGLHDG